MGDRELPRGLMIMMRELLVVLIAKSKDWGFFLAVV